MRVFALDDSLPFFSAHFVGHRPEQRSHRFFGHVHIAKTGGTTLNGVLAMKYQRICGNKGYSYDYYQANKRFNETQKVGVKLKTASARLHPVTM